MAVYGFKRLLIPKDRWDEALALLEQGDGSVRPFHDVTEGGDVHILRFTGRRVVDKPLHGH